MAIAAIGVALLAGASAAAAAYAAGIALAAVIAVGIGTAALSYISSSQMMNVGQMGYRTQVQEVITPDQHRQVLAYRFHTVVLTATQQKLPITS